MSLLIKALDKAQAEKTQSQQSEAKSAKASANSKKAKKPRAVKQQKSAQPTEKLSLSPDDERITEAQSDADSASAKSPPQDIELTIETKQDSKDALPASLQDSAAAKVSSAPKGQAPAMTVAPVVATEQSQAQAANVFTSKRIEPKHQTAKIAMILGLLALAILAVFAYWYQFVFNQPEVVIPPRPAAFEPQVAKPSQIPTPPNESPAVALSQPVEAMLDEAATPPLEVKKEEKTAVTSLESNIADAKRIEVQAQPSVATQSPARTSVFNERETGPAVEATLAENEQVIEANNADVLAMEVEPEARASASQSAIKITQKKTENGVNAILMRAYEAYNSGNDAQAQSDYKVVLKRYGLNVDAMLGLGAIATRQGRNADAQGWYQKVLQVEPRNEVAKAGLLSLQGNEQQGLSVSQIKSMLQASPTDANLQATLGDLYAQQGQWADAQQAYFEAYRLKQTAENAFNLAVSLDQMGKASIALPYYKEAQMKAGQSNVIDQAALKARISSIE